MCLCVYVIFFPQHSLGAWGALPLVRGFPATGWPCLVDESARENVQMCLYLFLLWLLSLSACCLVKGKRVCLDRLSIGQYFSGQLFALGCLQRAHAVSHFFWFSCPLELGLGDLLQGGYDSGGQICRICFSSFGLCLCL